MTKSHSPGGFDRRDEALVALENARKVVVAPEVSGTYAKEIARLRGVGMTVVVDDRLAGKNVFVPIPKSADAAEEERLIVAEALKPSSDRHYIANPGMVAGGWGTVDAIDHVAAMRAHDPPEANRRRWAPGDRTHIPEMVDGMREIPAGVIGFRCNRCRRDLTQHEIRATPKPGCPKCGSDVNMLVTVKHRRGGLSYVGMYVDEQDPGAKVVAMSTTTLGGLTPMHLAMFDQLGITVETDDTINSGELAMFNVPNMEKVTFYKELYNLPATLVPQPARRVELVFDVQGGTRLVRGTRE